MTVMLRLCAAILAVVITISSSGAPVMAQRRPEQAQSSTRIVNGQHGTITGTAQYRNTRPLSQARVRLRDVTTGATVATTQADPEGRFTFTSVPPGTYLVEIVDVDDKVRAVGETFAVPPGGTAGTIVRLGSDAPRFGGFFNNAALVALAAAAALGITALVAGGQPASPAF